MKVFVTGGTGFVGQHLVARLLQDGHRTRLLVRKDSFKKIPPLMRDAVEVVYGDPFDSDSLSEGMEGCEAVINLIGIIRAFPKKGVTFETLHYEATKRIAIEARRKGIRRFIQMSALGVDWDEKTDYFRTKWKADRFLIDHEFDYTIFRPSVIFGDGDGFVTTLEGLVRSSPLLIIPGSGEYPMQPVYVGDVARFFSRALTEERSLKQIFTVTGPRLYFYKEILHLIARKMGKKRLFLHLSTGLLSPIVIFFERFPSFPLTYDQLIMLTKGSEGDNGDLLALFGEELKPFEEYLGERFGK